MNLKILFLALIGVSLGFGLWHGTVYANNAYPGVTVSDDNLNKKDKPVGYRGLIPGSSNDYKPPKQIKQSNRTELKKEDPEDEKYTNKNTAKSVDVAKKPPLLDPIGSTQPPTDYSLPRKSVSKRRVQTLLDVNIEALKATRGGFNSHVEKDVLSKVSLPASMIESLMKPRETEEGLSMLERAAQIRIQKLFAYLGDAKTPAEKKETIRKIKNNLSAMANNYEMRQKIPRRMMLQIGLPDVYLDRQEKEIESVLDMIESAQKSLKNYRFKPR